MFCNRLKWYDLEALFRKFGERLYFGSNVSTKLLPLLEIPGMETDVAQVLWDNGYSNPKKIAQGEMAAVVKVLRKTLPVGVESAIIGEEQADMLAGVGRF